jgi:hypothetical protein
VSREGDIPQGLNSESGPPWESAGPLDIQSGPPRLVQDLHVCKPDPTGHTPWVPNFGCGKSEQPHAPVVRLLGAAAEDRR